MDLRDIDVEKLFGSVIGFFGPMNGGKTQAVVSELERVLHTRYNVIGYNSSLNTRDRESLTVDGRINFPGKTVKSVSELRADLHARNEAIMSSPSECSGNGGFITFEGIKHKESRPIKGVGIDEVNLFCLTEKDTLEMLDFFDWTKQKGIVVYLSGLVFDFKHMPFGNILYLNSAIDIKEEKKPVCKAVKAGEQCGASAMHTQRLWSKSFAAELGLTGLLNQEFDFATKEGTIVSGKYVPAPFFDKTIRIEETRDGRVVYLPVCTRCARLPYKQEVFAVYNSLVNGTTSSITGTLLEQINQFLNDERWIDRGIPLAHYKNIFGGFSPGR